jgi:hypothetical protein
VSHSVTVTEPLTPGGRYAIDCACCGEVGTANDLDLADVIKRLHEAFVAMLVDAWEVAR